MLLMNASNKFFWKVKHDDRGPLKMQNCDFATNWMEKKDGPNKRTTHILYNWSLVLIRMLKNSLAKEVQVSLMWLLTALSTWHSNLRWCLFLTFLADKVGGTNFSSNEFHAFDKNKILILLGCKNVPTTHIF